MSNINDLPVLEYLRTTFQRHRIQMGNRIAAVESGRSTVDIETIQRYMDRFQSMEDEVTAEIALAVKEHPMWEWFERVKGIGPSLAGCLLAHVDIERATSISALWKYAGQGVTDGQSDRRTKGEKLPYNADLKRICYLIGTSFLKSGSPYRREYDEAKEFYQCTKPDWTPKHIDYASRRKMVKLFLSHFWTEYRTLRGLPLRAPYAMQVLNHDGYKPAEQYIAPPKVRRRRLPSIKIRMTGKPTAQRQVQGQMAPAETR